MNTYTQTCRCKWCTYSCYHLEISWSRSNVEFSKVCSSILVSLFAIYVLQWYTLYIYIYIHMNVITLYSFPRTHTCMHPIKQTDIYIYIGSYWHSRKKQTCALLSNGELCTAPVLLRTSFALKMKLPSMKLLNPTCEPSVRHWLLGPLVINHGRLENPRNEWRFS